jgi:trans-aconitate methyltransferase
VDVTSEWIAALARRHLERLTLAEVRRGLVALSSLYVERRARLPEGAAFEGAGKRAAYALFYTPLHFFVVRDVVRALDAVRPAPRRLFDLGCGTGAAGAAWASQVRGPVRLTGVDRSGWAIDEARWNWRTLGVEGHAERGDLLSLPAAGRGAAVVVAFTANELDEETRTALRDRLLASARRGAAILVVEPIARRVVPWWDDWADALAALGARADAWRFPATLPDPLATLDHGAHLDHSVLTARTLYLPPRL